MVGVRLSSTWFLTSTIFLNRIRRLMYYAIYSVKMAGDTGADQPAGEDPAVRRLLSEVPLKSRLIPSEIYIAWRMTTKTCRSGSSPMAR